MKRILSFFTIVLLSCTAEETSDEIETSVDNNEAEVQLEEVVEENQNTTTSGESIEYYPNGAVKMKGNLDADGNRNGLWVSYYDNGTKWSESYYANGKRAGHSLTFFPNGQVRYIGEYQNDEKTGTWKFYDEEGNLQKEENF